MNNELNFEQLQGMVLAQQAAYVALVRHLGALNVAAPAVLASDLRTLAGTQTALGWGDALQSLANVIELSDSLQTKPR